VVIKLIFVLDVGNTNIVLGVYENNKLKRHWKVGTDRNKTEDEFGMLVKNLFSDSDIHLKDIDGVIISSVVPPIMFALESMCQKYFHIKPLIVGPGIKTGLNIKSDNPREVGADRIVNAVAGIHFYGAPLVIVDFGTATTYCYIDENYQYLGGIIAPGIKISTEALYTKASKLPRIEIAKPKNIVGKNTVDAMQSGIFYGYVGQVEGIVGRIKKQYDSNVKVVATGGLANLIAEECKVIDKVDPFLTLEGLNLIYFKN
jgi:type III pantothenate kinase